MFSRLFWRFLWWPTAKPLDYDRERAIWRDRLMALYHICPACGRKGQPFSVNADGVEQCSHCYAPWPTIKGESDA